MLTGSFASSYHGAPRATQDIDLVIAPTLEQVRSFVKLLPKAEYYVSENAAVEAVHSQGQFNVIDLATGWKVDLIVCKSRAFSREEFQRRVKGEIGGVPIEVATVEDLIIAKLEWAKLGGSERQLEDVATLLFAQAHVIDTAYVQEWVIALGLEEQWSAVQRTAEEVGSQLGRP